MKVLTVFGTRPEAIKMAPVVKALQAAPGFTARVCVTGQHREMLDQVLDLFDIRPDHDLAVMGRAAELSGLTAEILQGMTDVLDAEAPDRVLVHGDTTTAMAAAMAAYYKQIAVGHVEAGLRTYDIYSPWPEEVNRQVIGRIANLHFAPTASARDNLVREQVACERVTVTGNTVIDALKSTCRKFLSSPELERRIAAGFPFLADDRKLVLVTGHRRENFDGGLERVFRAIGSLAESQNAVVVFPVHPNPRVREAAEQMLGGLPDLHLIAPQGYAEFVWLMRRAHLIVTDSGGIQEEAPSLGKPVLVTRDVTERPEAVEAGSVRLVGTDPDRILSEARRLLMDERFYSSMVRQHGAYGDGAAAERIVDALSIADRPAAAARSEGSRPRRRGRGGKAA